MSIVWRSDAVLVADFPSVSRILYYHIRRPLNTWLYTEPGPLPLRRSLGLKQKAREVLTSVGVPLVLVIHHAHLETGVVRPLSQSAWANQPGPSS